MIDAHIILFSKAPQPGLAKTRLIPALGVEGAARLAGRMLQHAVEQAAATQAPVLELCVSPSPHDPVWQDVPLAAPVQWSAQGSGDLGDRMARAAARVLERGSPVILLGSDCPSLETDRIREAALLLQTHDVVINPASDGGYVLLGLNNFHPCIFEGIPWSTPGVCTITLERLQYLGWHCAMLPELADIDEPSDLARLPEGWL